MYIFIIQGIINNSRKKIVSSLAEKNLQLTTPKTATLYAKIPRKTTPNYAKLC